MFSIWRYIGIFSHPQNRPLRCVASLVVLALIPTSFYATSILIVDTGSVLYLATDSLQTNPAIGYVGHYCKIRRSGNLYWAAASDFYKTDGFDVESLVASVGTKGSVQNVSERFINAATDPLKRVIAKMKTIDPTSYRSQIVGKCPLLIGFVSIEHGKNAFEVIRFHVSEAEGEVIVKPERIPQEAATVRSPRAYSVGASDAAYQYLKVNYDGVVNNLIPTIRGALQADHIAHPSDVDGPYSILGFNGKKAQWIEKGQCNQKTCK